MKISYLAAILMASTISPGVSANTVVEIQGTIDWMSFEITQGSTALNLCCSSVLNYTYAQAYYSTFDNSSYDWQYDYAPTSAPWLTKEATKSISDGSADGLATSTASMDLNTMAVSISGTNDFYSVGDGQLNLGAISQRQMYYALPSYSPAGDPIRIAYDYAMSGVASTENPGDFLNILNTDAYLVATVRLADGSFVSVGSTSYSPATKFIGEGTGLSFSEVGTLLLEIQPEDWGAGASLLVAVEMRAYSSSSTTTGNVVPAPEPTTLALFGLGLAGLGAVRRKKLAA